MKSVDKAGVIVFGTEASIESTPNTAVDLQKIQAVVGTERTDLAAAIRLGTAAFPETGQKRLVLLTDGNENIGDALAAVLAAKPLGVASMCCPWECRGRTMSPCRKLQMPPRLKKSQSFEVKIFVQTEQATTGHRAAVSQRAVPGRAEGGPVARQEPVQLPADPAGARLLQLRRAGGRARATRCPKTTGRPASPPCRANRGS